MNSAMIEELLGGSETLNHPIANPMDLYELSREGIPKAALTNLIGRLGISLKSITDILNVTERTLQRKKAPDILSRGLSEQVIQIAEVYSRGQEVFESMEDFKMWMTSPSTPLGHTPPFDLLSSRYGAQMVLDELGRIEQGIFA